MCFFFDRSVSAHRYLLRDWYCEHTGDAELTA